MNIQSASPIRRSLLLALLAAAGLVSGCVPGQVSNEPPPAGETCKGDADCTASAPHCGPEGACVACLQDDHCVASPKEPVCDETLSCRACEEHGECASSVCNRETGACVAESAVAYVASGGTGDCSRAAPCGTIAAALDLVRADNDARSAIRLGSGTYTEPLALSDVRVRIIADGATIQLGPPGESQAIPAPDPTRGAAIVSVGARAHVTLEGVRIQGTRDRADVSGLHCFADADSTLQLLGSTVADHAGLGILTQGCIVTLSRSAVTNNAGGGLLVIDSAFDVTNSYFLDNGDVASSSVPGVTIRNDVPVISQRFAFNTVTGNQAGPEVDASGVSCHVLSGYTTLSSNIVLVGLGGKRSAAGNCHWVHSNLEGLSAIDPTGFAAAQNVDRDCMIHAREDGLPSITAGAPCADQGEPDLGILVDYDGNPRSPTAPDIGADEL
jgi:hypothetical protein